MASDDPYPHDQEVVELVTSLNEAAGHVVARVIDDVDAQFDRLKLHFPPDYGGIDWRKAELVSSSGPRPDETQPELIQRVLNDFRVFCKVSGVEARDKLLLLSDDFYSIGLECEAESVPAVLTEWLSLPHAIFVVRRDSKACLHVAFVRSSYVGHGVDVADKNAGAGVK